ncbi:MAG: RNA pyrophosphohydrolase [Alphaproteobacteria bacterium]|nr:RNA pyrophosphohydrolase [Alphaproteobacteria bacterium]
MEKKYRKNVGLMIVNEKGLVWMGERVNAEKFGFKYQMPQGGMDLNETPLDAAFRELYEETGLTKEHVEFIKESKEWHQYDFFEPLTYPEGVFHGQKQKWFLFSFKGTDDDFNLKVHPQEIEFASYFWCEPEKMIDLVVPFKRPVYQKIIEEFLPYF